MLTLALSLLGGGGAIGALLWFIPGAREILSGIARAIPPRVWLAIAVLALIGAGVWWFNHAVDIAYKQGRKDGSAARDQAWHGAIAAWNRTADVLRARAEAADRARSELERQIHDQEVRTIDARARSLLLRGPGKAGFACGRSEQDAGLSASPGGRDPAGGAADDGMAGLPADEPMATVPWPELVERARAADEDRAEVTAWRRWYAGQSAAWAARKAAPPAMPDPLIGK